jgi:hypothetical protein
MPLADYKLLMPGCQVFCVSQFAGFEARRFPQSDMAFHLEHRLAVTFTNVDMNGPVFVAVKEKPESFLYENSRHAGQ